MKTPVKSRKHSSRMYRCDVGKSPPHNCKYPPAQEKEEGGSDSRGEGGGGAGAQLSNKTIPIKTAGVPRGEAHVDTINIESKSHGARRGGEGEEECWKGGLRKIIIMSIGTHSAHVFTRAARLILVAQLLISYFFTYNVYYNIYHFSKFVL